MHILLVSFIGMLVSIFFGGFVASILWGWFVVPLGFPAISFIHAVGLVVLLKSLRVSDGCENNEQVTNMGDFYNALAMRGIGWPLVYLVIGFLLYLVM